MALTLAVIGEHLDLSPKSALEQLRNIGLSLDSSLDEVRVAYIRRLRRVASGHHPEDVQRKLANAKAREAEVSADLKSVELGERIGLLVPAAEVEMAIEDAFGAVRTELSGLPDRIADLLDELGIHNVDSDVFDGLVSDTLAHLAANEADAAEDEAPSLEDVSAA